MNDDLQALAAIRAIVDGMPTEVRERVLRWTVEHYGMHPSPADNPARSKAPDASARSDGWDADDPAEMFAHLQPETEADRVLVIGYWYQVVKAATDLDGFQVNSTLRGLGHAVSNVTRVFSDLMARRPALALQVRKSGRAKQARKTYRLTREGIRVMEGMLARNESS